MSDIVERLRSGVLDTKCDADRVRLEAAAEIEFLKDRVAGLESARDKANRDALDCMAREQGATIKMNEWKAEALAWRKRAKYDGSKGEFNAIKMSDAEALVAWLRATHNLPKG